MHVCVYLIRPQACPLSSKHIRAVQCSSYNNQPFMGRLYKWEPFNEGRLNTLVQILFVKLKLHISKIKTMFPTRFYSEIKNTNDWRLIHLVSHCILKSWTKMQMKIWKSKNITWFFLLVNQSLAAKIGNNFLLCFYWCITLSENCCFIASHRIALYLTDVFFFVSPLFNQENPVEITELFFEEGLLILYCT